MRRSARRGALHHHADGRERRRADGGDHGEGVGRRREREADQRAEGQERAGAAPDAATGRCRRSRCRSRRIAGARRARAIVPAPSTTAATIEKTRSQRFSVLTARAPAPSRNGEPETINACYERVFTEGRRSGAGAVGFVDDERAGGELEQGRASGVVIAGDCEALQPLEPVLELPAREGYWRDRDDRTVLVAFASLGRADHLLTEVLARQPAGDLDVHVDAGLVPGEADHALGELVDVDLLAHLEREHAPSARDGGGGEHESDRLVGAHEVAGHRGVGDGDRPARPDLALERRDHAAATPEDVAEPHRAVRRVQRRVPQHDLLGDPLRRRHHAARRGGLVGGDADEVGAGGADTRVDDVRRSGDVREDRFARVLFEDGHVLVRGGVEDDLRSYPREQRVDRGRVADVAERELTGRVDRLHRVVQVGLVVIEEHQARGENAATCRAISDPIHPPPPVTSTRLPARSSRTGSRSIAT